MKREPKIGEQVRYPPQGVGVVVYVGRTMRGRRVAKIFAGTNSDGSKHHEWRKVSEIEPTGLVFEAPGGAGDGTA